MQLKLKIWFDKLTSNPKHAFIVLIISFVFLFFTNGVPFVYSDGMYYYHVAKSFVEHGTVASEEIPEYIDYRGHAIVNYKGKYIEVVSPGTSLFLIPGLYIADLSRTNETVYNDYFLAFNGHTLSDGISVLLTATIIGVITIYLIYKFLVERGFSKRVSMFSTFATFFSSYAVWYIFLSPAFTHIYEMFCIALIFWSFGRYQVSKLYRYIIILGIGIGLIVLIRPIFGVIAILFGFYLLFKKDWKGLLRLIATGIPFILLWLWYNYVSYGNLFATGYSEVRNEVFNFANANQLNVLFSQYRGWFVYSPVMLLGVIGLIILWKKSRVWSAMSLLIITAIVTIYGFWPAWWGGSTYGQRFLVLLVPCCALGLAYLINYLRNIQIRKFNLRKILLSLIIICTLWSLMLTVLYRFTPVASLRPSTDTYLDMSYKDRYSPIDIIKYHYNLIRNATSISNYISSFYKSGSGGNSLLVIALGVADITLKVDDRIKNEPALVLIAPPIMSQSNPDKIKFYLKNKISGEVYEGLITNPDLVTPIKFMCKATCSSSDPNVNLTLIPGFSKIINVDNYRSISLDNSPVNFYFEREFNIQYKGSEIVYPFGETEFILESN